MKSLRFRVGVVLLAILASAYTLMTKKVTLGLDLQGGSHLVLQVDVDKALKDQISTAVREIRNKFEDKDIPLIGVEKRGKELEFTVLDPEVISKAEEIVEEDYGDMFHVKAEGNRLVLWLKSSYRFAEIDRLAEQALETIRNRVDELGVAEPVIVRNGRDRIIVELPGVKDPEGAKRVIGRVAKLEFKEVVASADSLKELVSALKGSVPEGVSLSVEPSPSGPVVLLNRKPAGKSLEEVVSEFGGRVEPGEEICVQEIKNKAGKVVGYRFFVLKKDPVITGAYLKDAYPSRDEYGMPAVSFELNSEGARLFKQFTSKHIGKLLAIVLDGKVQSAPTIRSAIGSRGQITGHFSYQEARELSIVLRAGALPAPVTIIEETTVGPSLGKESIEKGIRAGIGGLVLVMLFMLLYYKMSGLIANLALAMNIAVLWSALALLGATLTLPGIAGFILTIGMAVDANVIIFERIKEELARGRNLLPSVEAGFSRAWGTIIDANVTTLIAAVVLFQFGTGPIKGFAVTLSLGILSSMFTAVFVTKVLLDALVRYREALFSL
jgi:preprotein translocase subunit SecD